MFVHVTWCCWDWILKSQHEILLNLKKSIQVFHSVSSLSNPFTLSQFFLTSSSVWTQIYNLHPFSKPPLTPLTVWTQIYNMHPFSEPLLSVWILIFMEAVESDSRTHIGVYSPKHDFDEYVLLDLWMWVSRFFLGLKILN